MNTSRVYRESADVHFLINEIPNRPEPSEILMCTPQYFDVTQAINAFMKNDQGELHRVDKEKAHEQWTSFRFMIESLSCKVHTLRGEPNLEDMVFAANQSFPFWNFKTGKKAVILSRMRKDKRKGEVPYFHSWYRKQGYEIFELTKGSFESNGDALWYPGKNLIFSGYGSSEHHRTDLQALEEISEIINCPIVGIELTHPDFYHLNTTLAIIDKNTCLVYPPGVGKNGMESLAKFFSNIVEVSKSEAYAPNFACNAFALTDDIVFIQTTATQTIRQLELLGKRVIPLETSEFIKSGGSVFCMKIRVY